MKSTRVKTLVSLFLPLAIFMSSFNPRVNAGASRIAPSMNRATTKSDLKRESVIGAVAGKSPAAASNSSNSTPAADKKVGPREAFGKMQLSFEPNVGQADSSGEFVSHYGRNVLSVSRFGARLYLGRPSSPDDSSQNGTEASLQMAFLGANPNSRPEALDELPGKTNYYAGNDPAQWRVNVPNYGKVKYAEVYSGVDVIFYRNQRQLEYDFVIAPGADPNVIKLGFQGARHTLINSNGDLVLQLEGREMRQRKPVIYQEAEGKRKYVNGRYKLTSANEVTFEIGKYDPNQPLVIDPLFIYSTYWGTVADETPYSVDVDGAGGTYITGSAFGQFERAFVAKLNAAGDALSYVTYLSGTSGRNSAYGIAVNRQGFAYIGGYTTAGNFPISGGFQSTRRGWANAFIVRLTPAGLLASSTYFGGSDPITGHGEFATALALDSFGNCLVTGEATSGDLPVRNAYQPVKGGLRDNFFAKFDPTLSTLILSSYLGGSSTEGGGITSDNVSSHPGNRIAVDGADNFYLANYTWSPDLPVYKALQPTKQADADAYVAKFTSTGQPIYITYLGGSGTGNDFANGDFAYAIACDSAGAAYVGGDTTSFNFPGVHPIQAQKNGARDLFLTKISPDGGAILYSTYLGGSDGNETVNGVAVTSAGEAVVAGLSSASNFPTLNLLQPARGGSDDAILFKVNASGSALIFSSYIGGAGGDSASALTVDEAANIYVTGRTVSAGFPLKNPLQSTIGGQNDAWVAKIDSTVFSVVAIVSDKGGNTGDVSVNVFGGGFQSGATIKLSGAGQPDLLGTDTLIASSSRIGTTLKLEGAVPGLRDVVVTLPNGSTSILHNGFTILDGGSPQVWVDIIGRTKIRAGSFTTFNVNFGNGGSVDAFAIPITLRGIPQDATVKLGFNLSQPAAPVGEVPIDWSQVPPTFQAGDEQVLPLLLPFIPAGSAGTLQIDVMVPSLKQFQLRASISPSYVQSSELTSPAIIGKRLANTIAESVNTPAVGSDANACYSAIGKDALSILGLVPGVHCGGEVSLALGTWAVDAIHSSQSQWKQSGVVTSVESIVQLSVGITMALLKCAFEETPPIHLVLSAIEIAKSTFDVQQACKNVFVDTFEKILQVASLASLDPNEKTGSTGAGDHHYLPAAAPLSYAIYYLNQPTASAPAARVTVTDYLDLTRVDLSTLKWGPITLGSHRIVPTSATTDFTFTADLRPDTNLLVDVHCHLDTTTGLLSWSFSSIDPTTGLIPNDPLAGFLAPGQEGSVFFTVSPKPGLPTGTEVRNQASIVFDNNGAIETPAWTNTLDGSAPVSHVLPLPAAQDKNSFDVKWEGSDNGSGIDSFSIFVSQDGQEYTPWLTDVSATQATFTGAVGSTYAFYSVAKDFTNNIEPSKSSAEATTTIAAAADLGLTNIASSASAVTGSQVTYTVEVTNHGSATATNVVVSDALSSGLSIISCAATGGQACAGSQNKRTVSYPTLAPNNTQTITIVAAIDCGTSDATGLTSEASVSSALTDPDMNNNSQVANITAANPPPVIACPAGIVKPTDPGLATAVVNYPLPQVTDNCSSPAISCSHPGGTPFPVGVTNVICIATDSALRESSCAFSVTIEDRESPRIVQCASDKRISTNGARQVALPNLVGEIVATDNVTAAPALQVSQNPAAGTLVGLGVTPVTITVKDAANNIANCVTKVTVSGFSLSEFVVFASEDITIGNNARIVSGSVGANVGRSNRNGPRDNIAEVELGEGAQVLDPHSKVAADTVLMRPKSQVHDILVNELYNLRGTVLGSRFTPLSLPLLTLPGLPSITPGLQDVEARSGQTRILAPGRYRNIIVRNRGTLILTGGVYEVSSIDVRQDGNIFFRGPGEVRVMNEMDTDQGCFIGPDPSALGLSAAQIVFYAQGQDDRGRRPEEEPDLTPTVVQIGPRNTFLACVYAPNGTIWLQPETRATGAFIGNRVRLGERTEIRLATAF